MTDVDTVERVKEAISQTLDDATEWHCNRSAVLEDMARAAIAALPTEDRAREAVAYEVAAQYVQSVPTRYQRQGEDELLHIMLSHYEMAEHIRALALDQTATALPPAAPVLSVRYLSMPESNGRENWTAILCADGKDDMTDGYCFARSEYPDRVRYDADRMRYLIGETDKRPYILDYDADKCSDYIPPTTPDPVSEAAKVERLMNSDAMKILVAGGMTVLQATQFCGRSGTVTIDAVCRALTKDGEAG